MASLTVEELKKAIANSGVVLQNVKGLKKDDYIKLYEEHVVLSESVDATFSDEEGPGHSNGVNSDGSESRIKEGVELLNDDELLSKLKEAGFSVGPIVDSTRSFYKKIFADFLMKENRNGFHDVDATTEMSPLEVSDNEIEMARPARKPSPQAGPSREASLPKSGPSRESSLAKESLPKPRKFSYIETIPRGSSQRIIEPFESTLRQRTPLGVDGYKGKWSPQITVPNVGRQEITEKKKIPWQKITLGVITLAAIGFLTYLYFLSPTDPYQLIEDEAEELTAQQV